MRTPKCNTFPVVSFSGLKIGDVHSMPILNYVFKALRVDFVNGL